MPAFYGIESLSKLKIQKHALSAGLSSTYNRAMHILIIEDDLDLGFALQQALKAEDISSEWLRSVATSPRRLRSADAMAQKRRDVADHHHYCALRP